MLGLPEPIWGTRTVDEYEKIECIGAGTYGQVYRARDKRTGKIVALKKIRTLNETQGMPVTTLREIKLLKFLRHKNLVGLVEVVASGMEEDDEADTGEKPAGASKFLNGSLYIVLEYVEHDLTGLIDRQYHFSDKAIKIILRQLLKVVHFLHYNNYLHRDIKCSNLLLTTDHVLKLADFGLSRVVECEHGLTNKVVTLWYRAPEILLGSSAYDSKIDLWSVGCVMAELLIGCPLFTGKIELEQINRIFEVCGSPTTENWPSYEYLPHSDKYVPKNVLPNQLEKTIRKAMESRNRSLPHGAMELLKSLLTLDPDARISAEQALRSSFFTAEAWDPPTSIPAIAQLPPSHEYQTKQLRREKAKAAKSTRTCDTLDTIMSQSPEKKSNRGKQRTGSINKDDEKAAQSRKRKW